MKNSLPRTKQPGERRGRLLEAAAHEVVERGLTGVVLDRVARRAGVSKGGLLHHFASRQALVDALFQEVLDRTEARMRRLLLDDPEPRGCLTRAYIRAVSADPADDFEARLLGATYLTMSAEPELAERWVAWVARWFAPDPDSEAVADRQPHAAIPAEDQILGRILRLAADGLWLEDCAMPPDAPRPERAGERRAVLERLVALTYTL